MPWYWILIILSAIVGPFEAMHALNKARENRERRKREENEASGSEPEDREG
jgi:hypothetical protein